MDSKENNVLIYQADNGITKVTVRFVDENLWLTQGQIAALYDTTQPNVSQHIDSVYSEGELDREATNKKFLLVRTDGTRQVRRNIDHYNLDMIIALGYCVQSQMATDIYATATDYDPCADLAKVFFATVQNKLHYAVHEHTTAEVIYDRMDSEKPLVGMTNFKGNYVTRDDVKIVSQFLDFAEFQALEQVPMTMKDWIAALDNQIVSYRRKLLEGNGEISHKQAIEKAEKEFEAYRAREMQQLESDFDRAVKQLTDKKGGQSNE